MALFHLLAITVSLLLMSQTCQATSYVAEGYFVIDQKAVENYQREHPGSTRSQAEAQMGQDIDYYVAEINQIFGTLGSFGLDLTIRVRSKIILRTNIISSSDLTNGFLVNIKGISKFQAYNSRQRAFSTLHYDFAILLTGYDLTDYSFGAALQGSAYVGKVCDSSKNIGIVENRGTFQTVEIMTQMIAHILGASNDGPTSEYVMSQIARAVHTKRWQFSSSSAQDIKKQIESLHPNCLVSTNTQSQIPRKSYNTYSGKLFDPDTLCRRRFNESSYMCKAHLLYGKAPPKGDKVCQVIYCRLPGTTRCYPAYPSDGQPCNCGKRCDDGKCSTYPSVPTISDCNCVYGDQANVEISDVNFDGSCSDLIDRFTKKACYNTDIQQRCCATCNRLNSGVAACQYGDKSSACTKYSREVVCPKNSEICCEYCRNFRHKRDVGGGDDVVVAVDDVVKVVAVDVVDDEVVDVVV